MTRAGGADPSDQRAGAGPATAGRAPAEASTAAEPASTAGAAPTDPAAAIEFATRVLQGWHFVAELSVLGQAMCACGQPWDYCEYRLLARRCGLTVPGMG